jgi:hypothetical protein
MGDSLFDHLYKSAADVEMAKKVKAKPKMIDIGATIRLWIGMLLAPIAWAVQLQLVYLTSEFGCFTSDFTWNHVFSGLMLVVAIFGGAIAWLEWVATGATTNDEGADPVSRRRFMALIGILISALFSVTIVAQWLPTLMRVPCGK